MATKPTKPETSPMTLTEENSIPEDELPVVEWYREAKRPSRQRNLTPLQRKERAEMLRSLRNPPSDETWVGRE